MGTLKEIGEIAVAFAVAWLTYHGLAVVFNTPMPIVSVVSNSMVPVLHKGDILIVTSADYNVGDIVIYERPEVPYTIVHRIIGESDKGFIIKGDNNAEPDPWYVKRNQILGKVRIAMPLLGYPRLIIHLFGI